MLDKEKEFHLYGKVYWMSVRRVCDGKPHRHPRDAGFTTAAFPMEGTFCIEDQ